MAILNNNPLVGASGNQGGYNINNSLRFRSSASAYLSRTPASAGNRKTWTYSGWIKRSTLNTFQCLLGAGSSGSARTFILFNAGAASTNDNILLFHYNGATGYGAYTTPVYRDPSAWYHIVVAVDTTQATSTNRIKIYVNGVQQTASGFDGGYPAQNTDFFINNNTLHTISKGSDGSNDFIDGYQAETYFVDGQQLTPSSFGETDTTTGVWKPKAYSGTYGTNGFYLKFSDIATTSGSNAGLGKDFSGNTNYWTTNNISVTAGTTYDAMTDSPTLTSATVANYPVMTPAYLPRGSYTLSEANLKCSAAYASSNYPRIMSSMGMTSGKYYWEYVGVTFPSTESCSIGIKEVSSAYPSATGGLGAVSGEIGLFNTGRLDNNGSTTSSFSTSFTTGDVIGMAFDATNGTLNYYKNGSAIGSQITGITAGTYAPAFDSLSTSQTVWNVNYGQRPFAYTPPSGFVALNTFNLPTPTILQGNKNFGVLTYTGNGSTSVTRSDTNAVNFTPDFVWIKSRSSTNYHNLYDVNRIVSGDHKRLYSNDTLAEESSTFSGATNLNGFVNGGFTTGAGGDTNTNSATYVAWNWKANGSPVTNTSGSITSTVSVNTTAGFSVVTYTANSNSTVGHGLGVAPKVVIMKSRTVNAGWLFGSDVIGWTNFLWLNLTNASTANSTVWNNTAPTSSVFTLGSGVSTANYGDMVAYCWAEIAGFSRFGSYTGNGSTDGPFVFTNFRPKFVMIKRTDATNDWNMYDSSIGAYNVIDDLLKANTSAAETTYYTYYIDFLSNGFKLRETDTGQNASGGTYIFMAFAENPFKNSLAR